MLMFTHSATAMIYYVIHLWNTCVPLTLLPELFTYRKIGTKAKNKKKYTQLQTATRIKSEKGGGIQDLFVCKRTNREQKKSYIL